VRERPEVRCVSRNLVVRKYFSLGVRRGKRKEQAHAYERFSRKRLRRDSTSSWASCEAEKQTTGSVGSRGGELRGQELTSRGEPLLNQDRCRCRRRLRTKKCSGRKLDRWREWARSVKTVMCCAASDRTGAPKKPGVPTCSPEAEAAFRNSRRRILATSADRHQKEKERVQAPIWLLYGFVLWKDAWRTMPTRRVATNRGSIRRSCGIPWSTWCYRRAAE